MEQKGSPVICEVNGTTCRLDDGMYDVKTHYGSHTVLLHSQTPLATSPFSSTDVPDDLPERLTSFTICAVDAEGRFVVEQGGTYEVGALQAVSRQADAESQVAMYSEPRVSSVSSQKFGRRRDAKMEVHRTPSKYSLFVKQFSKVFSTKGFQAAATEWRHLSAESKREEDVDALIAAVIGAGRHPLRESVS
ncbi:hypothetical protein JKF63_05890 [Porcisia hertigi]|uniref:Uncharacterized protein n=1 Tax=Porcisia hertigi TaxID=2761500 RepID=A0A836IIQ3_9TRYP|nr:hypothetical protein JKF63_05890 [Porcisia hertigi]